MANKGVYSESERERLKAWLENLPSYATILYHETGAPEGITHSFNVLAVRGGKAEGQGRKLPSEDQLAAIMKILDGDGKGYIIGQTHFPTAANVVSIEDLLDKTDRIWSTRLVEMTSR